MFLYSGSQNKHICYTKGVLQTTDAAQVSNSLCSWLTSTLYRIFTCSSEGSWSFKVFILLKLCIFYFAIGICKYFQAKMSLTLSK